MSPHCVPVLLQELIARCTILANYKAPFFLFFFPPSVSLNAVVHALLIRKK